MSASPPAAHPLPARIRPARALATTALTVAVVLGAATPAYAVSASEKLAVISSFTQSTAASYHRWNAARQNRPAWSAYGFDWNTDLCSASPDRPLGFDFRLPCHRHDFGYRNYKAVNAFATGKALVDSAFYADLRRECATSAPAARPACHSLAWTYYQAVSLFGSSAAVDGADVDDAAALLR
ncbi:phospholipase [Actinoplanes sp. NEAU-A12]|uniref:Phospholipase n=1 Tax=Actinoplanes sandaracinus TaxID=3045177 RepID=A0ABT6WNV8_9ACTN|nr:phospholipase [Actinoplanes sandaracinus]MDI6101384.1 phospholipase [Actinoplanes sandaracinus]